MISPHRALRLALRHRRILSSQLVPVATSRLSYQSYSLPEKASSPNREAEISDTPVAQAESLPKIHETRHPYNAHIPPNRQAAVPVSSPAQPPITAAQSPTNSEEYEAQKSKPVRPRSKLRARKAAMKLTPAAVEQLRTLLDQPDPKLIKVGVRNRGCSGLAYSLEYVDKPGAFDETVEQDGVKVLIDSKALFSIIGSEMDWAEDKLNQKFVFKNPNIKEQCGCGESFMV